MRSVEPVKAARPKLGRAFHLLLGATAISAVGTGMHATALPLLIIQLTTDPLALGLITFAHRLPWLLFSLHAGVLVDRLDRRRVMLAADIGRCLLLTGLTVLILTSSVNLFWLVLVTLAVSVGQVFFDVAAQAVIPDLVSQDPRNLSRANGQFVAAESNGEDLVGPPVGSLLFGIWTAGPFLSNAVSFAASGALISALRKGKTPHVPRPKTESGSVLAEIREGIGWLKVSGPIRTLVATNALTEVVISAQFAMLVLLSVGALGLSGFGYGLLMVAVAAGGVAGSLLAPAVLPRVGPGTVILFVRIMEALAIMGLGLTHNPVLAGCLLALVGGLMTAQKVVQSTLYQQIIPRHLFGRVLSAMRMVGMTAAAIGGVLGGAIANLYTVQTPYLVGGIFLLVVAVFAWPKLNDRTIESTVRRAAVSQGTDGDPR
jgi:MFS family permease